MELCDKKCNDCPFNRHKNSRMITKIFNDLLEKYGDGVAKIIGDFCPNLTCCFDCQIDDFRHVEGCKLQAGPQLPTLSAWVVFDHPIDFPNCFVARRFEVQKVGLIQTQDLIVGPTLEAVRAVMGL